MHVALELLVSLGLLIYYWLEAIVLFFVPAEYRSKNIKGQRVLITGSGSGIGRLMAARFSSLGCTVVLWDVQEKANHATLDMIKKMGGTGYAYTVDLSDRARIYEVASKVKSEVGDIDILVNNAGIVTGKKYLECPDQMILKTMEVNSMAHFWTVKAFLPAMLKANKGHIVNIASSAGLVGVNGLADYCASKFAAVGFDESLRFELDSQKKKGVHTTVVCPFFINTGMFDGAKSKFSFLLPIQKQEEAVDRIMEAVLTNQHIVLIPRILYTIMALKGLLPTKCQLVLNKFFGVNESMDNFRGRMKSQ